MFFLHNREAGILERRSGRFRFAYDPRHLKSGDARAVSLTLPLTEKPYDASALFPFFLGLLPNGWLLEIVCRTLKIDPENHFDLLAATCRDCIGAVSIVPFEDGAS